MIKLKFLIESKPPTNSVVKDLVYHLTNQNINTLNPQGARSLKGKKGAVGIHFGNIDQANNLKSEFEPGDRVFFVYIILKNPLRVPDWATDNQVKLMNYVLQKNIISKDDIVKLKKVYSGMDGQLPNDFIQTLLKRKGYDGLIYQNDYEGIGESYVVFDKEQIIYPNDKI